MHVFEKLSNTKFHENPSSGSRVFPMCTDRRADGRADGRTDMTNLIDALLNFAKAPRNGSGDDQTCVICMRKYTTLSRARDKELSLCSPFVTRDRILSKRSSRPQHSATPQFMPHATTSATVCWKWPGIYIAHQIFGGICLAVVFF